MRFTLLALVGLATALPGPRLNPRDGNTSYCPSTGAISDSDRLALFNAFNAELFDAANSNNADEVAAAFATYVSPDLIEHTASAASYDADVGFLSTLLPGTSLVLVGGLQGCFTLEFESPGVDSFME